MELIDLNLLDADAIYTAKHGLDPQDAVMAWPECARDQWWMRYYFQIEFQSAAQAA